MENQLLVVANQAGIAQNKTQELLHNFAGYFEEAKEIAASAKDIVVTEEGQKDLINKAREARKALKRIRLNVEETRKTLKEESLREGKAIDGISNVIKALIIPVEEHLEKQEKFIELAELARQESTYAERIERLSKYVTDVSIYSLRVMSNESFEALLSDAKRSYEARVEAEKKAEEERLENERKAKVWQDRKIELAPYADFIGDFNLLYDTSEEEYKSILVKAQEEKKKYLAEQLRLKAENEALLKKSQAELAAREQAEAKLREQKELEEKRVLEEKKAEENKKRLEEEQAHAKMLAPDKEKLLSMAAELEAYAFPVVRSREAQLVVEIAEAELQKIIDQVREKAKAL